MLVSAYPPDAYSLVAELRLYAATSQRTADAHVSSALGSRALRPPPIPRSPSDKPEQLDGSGKGRGAGDGVGDCQAKQHVRLHVSRIRPAGGCGHENGKPADAATSVRSHVLQALSTDIGAYPPTAAPLLYPSTSQCTANAHVSSSALGSKAVS